MMLPDEGTGEAVGLAEAPATPETAPADETTNLQELASKEAEETQEQSQPEETAEEPSEPVEEFDEVDFEGNRYKVPKALKSAFMAQKDYTQGKQAQAERNRELDSLFEKANQQLKATDDELKGRAKLLNLEEKMQPYAAMTQQQWMSWSNEAPIDAQNAFMAYQMMQQEAATVSHDLQNWQSQRSEAASNELATRIQETEKFARTIPGWTPEVGKEIRELAETKWKIPFETLQENINPALYDILYHARLGVQALQAKAAPQPPPQNLKPLTTVSAKQNAPVRRSVAEIDDMDEYVAARQAQMKAQGRR